MKPTPTALALRPLGYFLWGTLWTLMVGAILALAALAVTAALAQGRAPTEPGNIALALLLFMPICAYVFFIAPWWMLGQGMLGFALFGQALEREHRDERLARIVGGRHPTLEARIESPVTRLWTVVGDVGFVPGWLFAGSSLVIAIGAAVVLFVAGPVGAVAGFLLVAVGVFGAVRGIRSRIRQGYAKQWETDSGLPGLSPKYYKGVATREAKRGRDLAAARAAGAQGDIDRWAAAEVEHALRITGSAGYAARKGVPGALDHAIDTVVEAMGGRVTRAEAIELVRTGAMYRGTKPDYLPSAKPVA